MSIRVLLVDDHELTRSGVKIAIGHCPDLELVAEAGSCATAAESIRTDQPDVMVLDLMLPDGEGLSLVDVVREHSPHTRLLALSANQTREIADRALKAGCTGYLDKGAGVAEVASAIRAVYAGRTVINMTLPQDSLLGDSSPPTTPASPVASSELSEREREVLACIARGLTNQQAANEMFLSVKTVETYRSRLTRKLGLRGRAQLFAYAQKNDLLAT